MAVAPHPTTVTTSRPSFIWRTREELQDIAAREPTNPMPLYLLAHVLRRAGESRWRDVANEAMERVHHTPQRIYARGVMRITLGDWGGWTDYEMRLQNPDTIRDLFLYSELCWRNQRWDGTEDLTGKSLVVIPEQGLGDCLQMWRFLPALLDSAGTLILLAYPRLLPLARHSVGTRAMVWLYDVKPTVTFDRYVWSMSLPNIFGGLPTFRPLESPKRRPRLARRERAMRAGLCWAGSSDYLHDLDRSIPFETLGPLLARPEVEWFSLQVGGRAAEASGCAALRTPDPPLVTFADTADLIGQLDYVVTVDTSVAHLAGLLGVPTFLMLQSDSHWRWGLEDTTPWYPFMRLIRQPAFGDWAGAVRQLGTALDSDSTAALTDQKSRASM
jgi:hypothetical protein